MSTQVTLIGNLVADPELKFTQQGKGLVKFTVVTADRYKNADGVWEDRNTTFWNCVAWDALAEHIADSLAKGDKAIVYGKSYQKSWEDDKTGEKRSRTEVEAKEVGAAMTRATVRITRLQNKSATTSTAPANDDPWAVSPKENDPWNTPFANSEEIPPF